MGTQLLHTKSGRNDWWGLQQAWERGELSHHPIVIVTGGLIFAGFLLVLYLRGGGVWSQYEVSDFTQSDSRLLNSESINSKGFRGRAGNAFRFSIRIVGEIDGEVGVSIHQVQKVMLRGKVDWSDSFPHDENRALVMLQPTGPCTGKLTVRYRFHTHRL